jgi:hypothetical protein
VSSGFRVQGSGFRVQGSGFRVQGSGFRVQGSGFMVQGSEFRVPPVALAPHLHEKRFFIGLMTLDRRLKASREGSKGRIYGT